MRVRENRIARTCILTQMRRREIHRYIDLTEI
jgi:hypothetical protein